VLVEFNPIKGSKFATIKFKEEVVGTAKNGKSNGEKYALVE